VPREKQFIPFVGSTYFRDTDVGTVYSRDQYFENVILEQVQNPISGQTTYFLGKRGRFTQLVGPSWTSAGADYPTTTTTRAIQWSTASTSTNKYVAVGCTGTTIQLAIESLGRYTATASAGYTYPRYLLETLSDTTPALLVGTCQELGSPKCEWFFHVEGTPALTQISDAQFTAIDNVGEMVYLNGYHFIMAKDGKIYNSDLNSISSWSGDFIGTDVEPDQGAGLALWGETLVAFGTGSLELFKISNNPTGSPLEKIEQASYRQGALKAHAYPYKGNTIIKGTNGIYFISIPSSGSKIIAGIYKYDGKVEKISTPELDKLITDSISTNAYSTTLNGVVSMRGYLYLIGNSTVNSNIVKFFAINLSLKNHTTFFTVGSLGNWDVSHGIWSNCYSGILCGNGGGGSSNGQYLAGLQVSDGFSPDTTSAGGDTNWTATIQTGNIDFGTSRYKTFHQLRLVGEDPTSGSTNNWSVSWSDDDGASYSTARTINQASLNQWISGLGASRRRRFKFQQTVDGTNATSRLEGFELEYTVHGQ